MRWSGCPLPSKPRLPSPPPGKFYWPYILCDTALEAQRDIMPDSPSPLRRVALLSILTGLLACLASGETQTSLLKTFVLKEAFGVSHPRQIVDFDFDGKVDATRMFMLGPPVREIGRIPIIKLVRDNA